MEDNQSSGLQPQNENQNVNVSFPSVGQQPKKSSGAKTLLVVGILILVLVLGFIIFRNNSETGEESTVPTPFEDTITQNNSTPTPSATSTAKPVDKSAVKITIQNGTGIVGEAAFLQTQLKTLGYTNITVGNASSQDQTVTTVTFSKSLAQDLVDELTKKLKELYQEVTVKTSTSATTDVVIVTGLRKGATSKASATPATTTPKASVSPTPTPTATASN